jgi:hypothetical protein
MGFLSGITKAFSGIAKTVSKVAGGVANIAGKALNFIQSPMSAITSPLKKLAGGLLDKMPFNIGKFAKPFVDKFIDGGASMLLGGPLAGLSQLTKFAPTIQSIADIAEKVKAGADKVGALAEKPSLENAQNLFAYAQAQKVF